MAESVDYPDRYHIDTHPIPPFCKGCGSESIKAAHNYCKWCGKELTERELSWK